MRKALDQALRAAALVVTDRRWAAPLSAMALGFGLFVGVAIGPNAAGTLAGVAPIVELPSFTGGTSDGGRGAGRAAPVAEPAAAEGGGLGAVTSPLPLAPESSEPEPLPSEPKPRSRPPAKDDEEEGESGETQPFEGVVVQANPAAGSYALAIEGGELLSVHAAKLPAPGTKLALTLRRLDNDTFAEAKPGKAKGAARRVTFRGAVTFVGSDPAAPAYTVSGRGTSILVHVRPDPTGAPPPLPALGSYATVTAEIAAKAAASSSEVPPLPAAAEPVPAAVAPPTAAVVPVPDCVPDPTVMARKPFEPAALLWQSEIELEGEPTTYVDLAGIVTAICASEAKLLISADGFRQSGSDLVLAVPAGIQTDRLVVGDSIVATATIGEGGALTLAGLAGDERTQGAEDSGSAQGDLKR